MAAPRLGAETGMCPGLARKVGGATGEVGVVRKRGPLRSQAGLLRLGCLARMVIPYVLEPFTVYTLLVGQFLLVFNPWMGRSCLLLW